jgi:hypothetical protein
MVSSTLWIFGTLYTTGVLHTEDDTINRLPAVMIYVVQYGLGALAWLALSVDRMLSRYAMVIFTGANKNERRTRGRLFRLFCLGVPFVAFAFLTAVVIWLDAVQVNEVSVTDQRDDFEVVFVAFLGMIYVAVAWLAILTRRIIGAHHELIRLLIFCLTTFIVFGYDAVTTLLHDLQTSMWAQRALLIITLMNVFLNLVWIFVLAMKPQRHLKGDLESGSNDLVKRKVSDKDTTNQILDTQSIASTSNESLGLVRPASLRLLRRPRRSLKGVDRLPIIRVEEWLSRQPEEAKAKLDCNQGYFVADQVEASLPGVKFKAGKAESILKLAETLAAVKP